MGVEVCLETQGQAVPLGATRRIILVSLGTVLSTISIVSTILFQLISKKDNTLRQRGRYLVSLQGYCSTFFLFVICFYQAYKCRIPCALLFWGSYAGLVPYVLVYTGRVWRLITRFDRNKAIYQSRFAEPSDYDSLNVGTSLPKNDQVDNTANNTHPSPSLVNLATLHSYSDASLEQEKVPHSSQKDVTKKWYNRYRTVTDHQMLLIALTFLFVNFAIGIGFQATTEGIGLSPISYQCHTGPQYIFPYTVTIFFLFVLSPFMVYQLKGISDGFGIRNELIFLSAFSAPCFTAYFLVPAIADDFSERFVDKTTWMALILIAGHINSIMIPISRYFKTHPHQCAYKAWVSQRKIERERETQQRTVAQVSAISEDGTEVTLPTHMPISRVDSNGDKSDLRDQEMAMEEFGSDYHSRKGSITNINNTIKNLARNQRKQGFRVGVGNSQGGTFDSKRVDWDEFIRVLEDRRLFDRLSAFTVREFCAENTRFLYEVTRLERRAIQYERLRNLSSTPVIASTTTPEQRLFPHTTQLSKSPSTSTTHSTTHSTLGPLPTQLTYAESQHRIKKIVSASSVGSSAPMLRTRRSSLSYVDDSEPSSPMASSSMSTFMRYGPTSALPDLEEGLVANKAEGSSAKSKSEVKLEVVEMVSHDITPFPMPPTLLIQFEYVYTTFISVGGRLELNLSHSTVQDIHRKARQANWSSGMFDGAVYEIQELLFRDVWPKFVTSSHGLNSNLPQSSDAASQNSRRLGYGGGAQAAESASTVYMPFEQHQSSTQQRFSPQPQRQPQAVSTRSTPSPSVHMVSPKSSMSAATSSRAVGSLSDSGSIGPAGSVKSWRDDEFQEEPSRSGFRTWLSKKSRTGITAAVLMSREGSNDESLGIIEQSRKSTAADRRSDTSALYSSSIHNSLAKPT